MSNRFIPYCTLLFVVFTSTLLVWVPFITKQSQWIGLSIPNADFSYIYKNFDGPLYIIPAKTMYNPKEIQKIDRDPVLVHKPMYYAAHLPLYPFFIRLTSVLVGYSKAMISVTFLASIALSFLMYIILKHLRLTKNPLALSAVFLFFPRLLIVRSVGSPEPLFLFFILGSLFAFERQRYWAAGLLGAFATMTKTPGILLFVAYLAVFVEQFIRKQKKAPFHQLGIFLIPFGLVGVFALYAIQYRDFFAYFKSGDNVHLVFPFSVFNAGASWVGSVWLEDIILLFFLYGFTIFVLKNSPYRSFFYFSLVFFTATLFIQHRDISRYSLPLWPMMCIAFEKVLTSRRFLFLGGVLVFGIYMFTWNFLIHNIMPITEWLPFL